MSHPYRHDPVDRAADPHRLSTCALAVTRRLERDRGDPLRVDQDEAGAAEYLRLPASHRARPLNSRGPHPPARFPHPQPRAPGLPS